MKIEDSNFVFNEELKKEVDEEINGIEKLSEENNLDFDLADSLYNKSKKLNECVEEQKSRDIKKKVDALAKRFDVAPSKITPYINEENIYSYDDSTYDVVTKKEALKEAKEYIIECMVNNGLNETFDSDFNDWIVRNAVNESYIKEASKVVLSETYSEKEYDLDAMIEQLDDKVSYVKDFYGDETFYNDVDDNAEFDYDKIVNEAIKRYGLAYLLHSQYELDLGEGLFAYRLEY